MKCCRLIDERELLQIDVDNTLQMAKELSRRLGDSSGTKYVSEFPMAEIKEAAWNFDPSLKIGEGGCMYRGFLRNTPVAIKMMKFRSVQGSQEFQQEVRILERPLLVFIFSYETKTKIIVRRSKDSVHGKAKLFWHREFTVRVH